MNFFSNYFINPISTLIAFILTFIHFLLISLPFYIAILPALNYTKKNFQIVVPDNLFIYLVGFMFVATIIYIFLDILFGFTIKDYIQDTILISDNKELDEYDVLFKEVASKYDIKNVKFLLDDSSEINAYAIATFRKKYIVITTAMINHINNSFEDTESKKEAFKGLIGHEFSHLLNWDFLPNLILLSGQHVSFYTDKALRFILNMIISGLSIVPLVGGLMATAISTIYIILNIVLNSIYTYIISPIYKLTERYLGRLVEYRSDFQSAQTLDWLPMFKVLYSLLLLNSSTYHSKFSTHPNTISRMLNIYNIPQSINNMSVSFFSKYFGLIIICSLLFSIPFLIILPNDFLVNYNSFIAKVEHINKFEIMQTLNNNMQYIKLIYFNLKDLVINFTSQYNINIYALVGSLILCVFILIYLIKYITF